MSFITSTLSIVLPRSAVWGNEHVAMCCNFWLGWNHNSGLQGYGKVQGFLLDLANRTYTLGNPVDEAGIFFPILKIMISLNIK